ncbi:hypothetical protein V5799_003861 [Amblyomma americanum]|uniref:Cuticle protein n=1 Tax=Amblyomma americanum TaxID=6943 RepID=A0AAQ4D7R8_AMBAM
MRLCLNAYVIGRSFKVYAPQPYQFGYETQDEYGNRQSRHEQDAGNGVKTGMYGFRDAHGLFRQVQYVADHRGFRAWVKTNEPGTQDSAPASARIESQQPHAAQIASAAAAAAPHHYRLVAPRPQPVLRLAPVAATPALVATPLTKVPVHHSLYPIGGISARHGPIQQAYSQQVPVLRKPSFRRLAARPAAVVPVVTPVVATQGSSPVSIDYAGGLVSGSGAGLSARSASSGGVRIGGSGGVRSGGSGGGSAGGSAGSSGAAAGGSARTVKKVRRRKPAEFFKKSIINKPRPKPSGPRVRVVQVTKNGGVRTVDVPVYKD